MRYPQCCPVDFRIVLLRSALCPIGEALPAWQDWRSRNSLEVRDHARHKLLPQVFRKFEKAPVEPADLTILRGIYRFHWAKNQLLARSAELAVCRLREGGVEVIVLKGLALALLDYRDLGLRPMADFDILVKPAQRDLAVEILQRHGWKPSDLPIPHLSSQHGCELANDQDHRLDLHWYATPECRWRGADDRFWARARPLTIHNAKTRALSLSDAFLHALIHGVKETQGDPVTWVSDACRLLAYDLDWETIVDEVKYRRLVPTVRLGLTYLREMLGQPIPDSVIRDLESTPVSLPDRLYFLAKIRGTVNWTVVARPCLDYWRSQPPGSRPRIGGFFRFLRERWHAESNRQVLEKVARRAWAGVSKAFAR